MQSETIFFSAYSTKIQNPNTQITNNIQIRKTNFRNILTRLLIFYDESECLDREEGLRPLEVGGLRQPISWPQPQFANDHRPIALSFQL